MRGKIESLITFLDTFQNSDGSFDSLSSDSHEFKTHDYTYSTICATAYIAYVLSYVQNIPSAESVQKKAIRFLLKNKSESETWNYWNRESVEYTTLQYPDDVDDTFASLIALHRYRHKSITGASLAHIVQGLVAIEKDVGGPYFTWYTKSQDPAWKDVDSVANAQIAYFLDLRAIKLPNLTDYIETLICNQTVSSPYYPSPIHCMYFIARWYSGKYTEKLAQNIISYLDAHDDTLTLLEIALAVSSLAHLKRLPENLLEKFHQHIIDADTCKRPFPFCIDPVRNGTQYISGSSAVTAAAAIEALYLSQKVSSEISPTLHDPIDTCISKARKRVMSLSSPLPIHIQTQLRASVKASLHTTAGKACMSAPYRVLSACNTGKSIPESTLEDICFAQGCGWAAYEIFDDCVDENKNEMLGIGLILYTHMHETFMKLLQSTDYADEVTDRLFYMNTSLAEDADYMSSRDKAKAEKNTDWSVHKSAGYLLGPLAILHCLGFSRKSDTTKNIITYYNYMIQALQLSDDAHDWREDILSQQRNAVLDMLPKLQSLPDHKRDAYFWNNGIDSVLKKIQKHCADARKAYIQIRKLENPDVLNGPLEKIETMCKDTLDERETMQEFLKTY